MSDDALSTLAAAAGLLPEWTDYRGQRQVVSPDSLRSILATLGVACNGPLQIADSTARLQAETEAQTVIPPLITARVGEVIDLPRSFSDADGLLQVELEGGQTIDVRQEGHRLAAITAAGYHQLRSSSGELTLAVAPTRAFGIGDIVPDRRVWGVSSQIYSLRDGRSSGIGDFGTAADLARRLAAQGADALAISPVHAQFSADLQRFSPYAPSSRLFLNVLHADPEQVFDSETVKEARMAAEVNSSLSRLEALPLVDWPAVARLRLAVLRALWSRLPGLPTQLQAFERFRIESGGSLESHARFEAIQAAQLAGGGAWHWKQWPEDLRDPASPEIAAFAIKNSNEVGFYAFAQWVAEVSLAATQRAAREAGMRIGLISDLAVGADGGGSQAWSSQADLLIGLSVGAPPDLLNTQGQDWGLTTFSPLALRTHGYAPFLAMLRAALKHAGGVRIDHILGLNRLWVVPQGAGARDGAYLKNPLDDLFRLIALESWRHRAIVIGEDLGTVPAGFPAELEACGILGMRVVWFERDFGYFIEPSRYPVAAMATPTTHDLPTIAGWWQGRDIELNGQVGNLSAEQLPIARGERVADRSLLWGALGHAGVAAGTEPAADQPVAVIDATLEFVAKTPSILALVSTEDLIGLEEQPNLPGTTDEHPNWRHRLPATNAEWVEAPATTARLERLARQRPKP